MAHPLALCAARRTIPQLITSSSTRLSISLRRSPPKLVTSFRSPPPQKTRAVSTTASTTMAPIPNTMKAMQMTGTGGVEVLALNSIPVPQLADGQILVRNKFAGVNYIDTYFRGGLYPAPHLPMTLGREGAGEVVAAHASVPAAEFPSGSRVVYMPGAGSGTYAEYTVVPAAKAVKIPDSVADDVAAAVFLQGLTAWTLVREAAEVKAGQWTLVHAAAGGVGLLLVQMLRSVGAKVIGTASTDAKLALAKENGAEWTINSNDDVVAKVKEITGGHGIDAIFDGVGKATFEGFGANDGNQSGAVPPVNILRLGDKNIKLLRPVLFNYLGTREALERNSSELFELVTSGKLNVAIHDVYPLSDLARAHNDLEGRKSTGKLLIKCT